MKKSRKLLSLLLAGVTAVTSVFAGSVDASAASKFKIIKTLYTTNTSLGQGLYRYTKPDGTYGVHKIGEAELKSWRKTGKFTTKDIKLDKDLEDKVWDVQSTRSLIFSDHMVITYKDDDKTYYTCLKYDEKKGSLDVEYLPTTDSIGVSKNGAISDYYDTDTEDTFKIINKNGKVVKTFNFTNGKHYWFTYPFQKGSKYTYVIKADQPANVKNPTVSDIKKASVTRVDENGKTKTIADYYIYFKDIGNNYLAGNKGGGDRLDLVYLSEKNKMYTLNKANRYTDKNDNKEYYLYVFTDKFWGTKSMGWYRNGTEGNYTYKAAIVDVANDRIVGDVFDGSQYSYNYDKTQRVDVKGKGYGFTGLDGNVEKWYDSATTFGADNDYTLVVKGEEMYFIDRDLERVSEKMKVAKGTTVSSFTGTPGLFYYKENGKEYFITYKK